MSASLNTKTLERPQSICHHVDMVEQTILTVSQLNHMAREVLEQCFASVKIEGEISNLSTPSSGHMYFTLKDENAQVRCAMFRGNNLSLKFKPELGMHVVVSARVSLYEGRGDYQLIVQSMEEAGDGKLQREFEALKKRLHAEGLFSDDHKKPLPTLPKCIGVVTSATGAALRDILSVLRRRFASIPVIIYPTAVQGKEAAGQICAAIQKANEQQQCDVLIVGRGGGSLEDLWPFNEEIVARAVYASHIPVVSGVGHEVDITICDFVADQRAATPTAAAELVSPDASEWLHKLTQLFDRLSNNIKALLRHATQELNHLSKRIRHPGQRLQEHAQQLDYLEQRLIQAIKHLILQPKQQQLETLSRALNAVSPLNTLDRGFAIATKDSKVLTNSSQCNIGDNINIRLSQCELHCKITDII